MYWVFFIVVTKRNNDIITETAVKNMCLRMEVLLFNCFSGLPLKRFRNSTSQISLSWILQIIVSKLNYLIIWRYCNLIQIQQIKLPAFEWLFEIHFAIIMASIARILAHCRWNNFLKIAKHFFSFCSVILGIGNIFFDNSKQWLRK